MTKDVKAMEIAFSIIRMKKQAVTLEALAMQMRISKYRAFRIFNEGVAAGHFAIVASLDTEFIEQLNAVLLCDHTPVNRERALAFLKSMSSSWKDAADDGPEVDILRNKRAIAEAPFATTN